MNKRLIHWLAALALVASATAMLAATASAKPPASSPSAAAKPNDKPPAWTPAASNGKPGRNASQPAKVQLMAHCAGDTISGEVRTTAPAGTQFAVVLYQQPTHWSPAVATGRQVNVTTDGRAAYPFSFNVAAYNAWAFRLDTAGDSKAVMAASCAPGRQVPEAPLPLLLPLSLLTGLMLVALRRRASR